MQPLVTVIMPVYNAQAFIKDAIESVCKQTFVEWELVIIDDGSTDESVDKIAEFLSDPRIRMIQQANQGPVAARNHGLSLARADLIAFLDADDLWLPEKLATHVATMQLLNCDATFSGWLRIGSDGGSLGIRRRPKARSYVLADFLGDGNIATPSVVVMRRSSLMRLGGFKGPTSVEDWYLWLRILLELHGEIRGIPKVLVRYRVHDGQLTRRLAQYEKARLELFSLIAIEHPEIWRRMAGRTNFFHHRVMSYTALLAGDPKAARKHIGKAFRKSPGRFLMNRRALMTLAGVIVFSLRAIFASGRKS